jgi:hypothetical protein
MNRFIFSGKLFSLLTLGFVRVYKYFMIQKVNSPVSVSFSFDSAKRKVAPKCVIWNNRLYPITKLGLHHTYRVGRTLHHVFSVATPTLFFRLVLNTENLHWTLEEISDDFTN